MVPHRGQAEQVAEKNPAVTTTFGMATMVSSLRTEAVRDEAASFGAAHVVEFARRFPKGGRTLARLRI